MHDNVERVFKHEIFLLLLLLCILLLAVVAVYAAVCLDIGVIFSHWKNASFSYVFEYRAATHTRYDKRMQLEIFMFSLIRVCNCIL